MFNNAVLKVSDDNLIYILSLHTLALSLHICALITPYSMHWLSPLLVVSNSLTAT